MFWATLNVPIGGTHCFSAPSTHHASSSGCWLPSTSRKNGAICALSDTFSGTVFCSAVENPMSRAKAAYCAWQWSTPLKECVFSAILIGRPTGLFAPAPRCRSRTNAPWSGKSDSFHVKPPKPPQYFCPTGRTCQSQSSTTWFSGMSSAA